MAIKIYEVPNGIPTNEAYSIRVQPCGSRKAKEDWLTLPAYSVNVSSINKASNIFNNYAISVASLDIHGPIKIEARYTLGPVETVLVRPKSYAIEATVEHNVITFTLDRPRDVMVQVNGNKWTALHLLTNEIDADAPTRDTDEVWYFGPGINNGTAYSKVLDGNLTVPSGKTVYLAGGAFLSAKLKFINVSNAAVRGRGFIYHPSGGAILIEGSSNINVENVTSLSATGFSLTAGESRHIHINGYRSFSSHGNGDGLDFFCSSDILVEKCFLRNSDDTIALYSHRWNYYGDSRNIIVKDCVLLPDIAHPIQIGTHGNPAKPETMADITFSNIDILDHEESQLWYQGCIAINAGDANLVENVLFENIRVEKITRGQLINIRVMQNAMWTTAPGRGVRGITFRNVELDMESSEIVNPSQILGYDTTRMVEDITFENLKVGNNIIYDAMPKPRWFMVSDFVPMFVNEHVTNVKFNQTK